MYNRLYAAIESKNLRITVIIMRFIPLLIFLFLVGLGTTIYAQDEAQNKDLIQFSGQVIMEDGGTIVSLPYVNVFIKEQPYRGDYTNKNGFFSIVAREGETVVFSGIGLETAEYTIPDTLTRDRYSIVQLMSATIYELPKTVIYPWPSREHFKIEFLAMDVTNELQHKAEENLKAETLEDVRNALPPDGIETAGIYLRQQAEERYAIGQFKPMRILSPLAWAKFFKALKEGKFSSKKGKDD